MVSIPPVTGRPWWSREWWLAVAGGVPVIVVSITTAIPYFRGPAKTPGTGWVHIGVGIWLGITLLLSVLIARRRDRDLAKKTSPDDLTGCLHVLYEMVKIVGNLDSSDQNKVRMTIHRVVETDSPTRDPEQLQQVIDYIGGGGGGKGRYFTTGKGIIGRAAMKALHEGKSTAIVAKRSGNDQEGFLDEMVEWGYGPREAQELTRDRCSWMAVPIMSNNRPIGIVYLDSDEQDFFDDKTLQNVVIRGVAGIATYVEKRYT